jgi:uncharacterized protein (DUF1684 family)
MRAKGACYNACMRIAKLILFAPALAGLLTAGDYANSVSEWRAQREARLKADDGWLTVVGLVWLKEGENRVGSNPAFEVKLPKSAPDRVGIITVKNGTVWFTPNKAANIRFDGAPAKEPAKEIGLKPDTTPQYDVLAVGRVKFYVIQRENRLGVRIKDNDSARRKAFTGLHWYPVDPSWKVQAKFVPFDKPRKVTFDTAAGVKEEDESPGYVTFMRDGKEYRLDAVLDDDELWFIMRDGTSGKTTYGASRFLYAPLPKTGLKQAGIVEIDFNKAENPPCVFTDFATCPLPPPQNRLSLPITAGEMMYGKQH